MKSSVKEEPMRASLLILFLVMALIPLDGRAQTPAIQSIQDVTFCQLAKSPSTYAGIELRVRVIYRFVWEESDIEQAECCPGNISKDLRAIISNGIPDKFTKKTNQLVKRLGRRSSGVALMDVVGRMDRGLFRIDRIEHIEHLSRPPDLNNDPSWVPHACAFQVSDIPNK